MARIKLDALRSGPTTVVGDAVATQTLATAPLATLTSGMANGDVCHVEVICSLANTYDYSAYVTLTCAIGLSAGPTYSLGTVSTSAINSGPTGSPINSGLTLDQNSGNLRVRAVIGSVSVICRAVFKPIGP